MSATHFDASTQKVADFLARLQRKAREQRIPINASFAITHRCNERCVHCYLGPQEKIRPRRSEEVSTEEACRLIDMLTDAGCLHLLLTGGEAMLRRDFVRIYTHAKRNGLRVTVFSNGTILRNEVLEAFKNLPPEKVDISLYGGTAETYETVTRTQGHGTFERALRNIRRLLDDNIKVGLKTVLMTLNKHELDAMKRISEDFGLKFMYDPAIFPFLDGDRTPLQYRVPLEEVAAIEARDDERLSAYAENLERRGQPVTEDTQYICGAGLYSVHIDPYGYVQPCLLTPHYRYNVLEHGFDGIWNGAVRAFRSKKAPVDFGCSSCQHNAMCGACPAFSMLENKAEHRKSEYVCSMTHTRADLIRSYQRRRQSIAPIIVNPRNTTPPIH